MINFNYVKPSSKEAAIAALTKEASAQFIAGGTNLVDLMKRGVATPQKVVDVTGLLLRGVEQSGAYIQISALTSNSEVADNIIVKNGLPLLSQALKAGASAQIRNMATVGGNIMQRTRCPYFYDTALPCNKREPGSGCSALHGYNRMHAIFGASDKCIAVHPSDMCVALIALDASVSVTGPKGSRKIPFSDFHRLPGNNPEKDNNLQHGELITSVDVPLVPPGIDRRSLYTKIRDRSSYAFALVSVAAELQIEKKKIQSARLAMGGVAHKPWRLTAAENYLKGKEATETNFQQAAALAMKEAKGYGFNDFKLTMAPNTIVSTLKQLAGV